MDQQKGKSLNLCYVLWRFPALSETFILNEMIYLRKILPKLNFNVYSIKKSQDDKAHKLVDDFMHNEIYIPGILSFKFLTTVLRFFILHPMKVVKIDFDLLKEVPIRISLKLSLYYLLQLKYGLIKGIYVAHLLKKNNVEHVHTHFSETAALIVRIGAFLAGIRYSLTTHAHDLYQNPNKILIANLVRHSKFCVTISEYNKRYILSLDNTLADKIKIVHCGINTDEFVPNNKKVGKTINILTVARLVATKGIKETIKVCALLPDEIKFKYTIIGTGPQFDELQALIERHKMQKKVELVGSKKQDEVLEFMKEADFFVLYCRIAQDGNRDGIPVALMEAMAMELPVISTSVSGIPELIKNGSGIIVKEEDEEGLFNAILKVASMSDEQRRKFGIKGREIIIEEFNIVTEVKKLAQLYQG